MGLATEGVAVAAGLVPLFPSPSRVALPRPLPTLHDSMNMMRRRFDTDDGSLYREGEGTEINSTQLREIEMVAPTGRDRTCRIEVRDFIAR